MRSASLGKHAGKTSNQKRPRVLVRFSLRPANLLGEGIAKALVDLPEPVLVSSRDCLRNS